MTRHHRITHRYIWLALAPLLLALVVSFGRPQPPSPAAPPPAAALHAKGALP